MHPLPAKLTIARRFPSIAALNTVLLADALRWSHHTVASIFSDTFRRAAQNARAYRLATLSLR